MATGGLPTRGEVVVIKKSDSDFNGKKYHNLELGGLGFSVKGSCTPEQYASVQEGQEVEFMGKFKPKPTDNGNIMKLEIVGIGPVGSLKKTA